MTESEIAWAAGLFEGEGTVYAKRTRSGRQWHAALFVTSTDRDVVEKFAHLVGASIYERPTESAGHYGKLPVFTARINQSERSLEIADLFAPWLGERRLDQIAEAKRRVLSSLPDGRKDGTAWETRRSRYGPNGGNKSKRDQRGQFVGRET